MPAETTLPADLDPSRTAFFLDFDGTLAAIVDDPQQAAVPPATLSMLARLRTAAGDALAVISGRSIEQLDAMLWPLRLPLAGVHGLERRDAAGTVSRAAVDADLHHQLAATVRTFVESRPGLLAEVKPGSVALHYRRRQEFEDECRAFARDIAGRWRRVELLEGKKVIEMKLGARTKGDAVAEFMKETPFRGRLPLFVGDDTTDEAGFAVVNTMEGITVKVGPGDTGARFRVADTVLLAAWLDEIASGTQPRSA